MATPGLDLTCGGGRGIEVDYKLKSALKLFFFSSQVIQPLGWRLVSSADISSKNLDANERGYALMGKPEDLHTWFFLFDETLVKHDKQGQCSIFYQNITVDILT